MAASGKGAVTVGDLTFPIDDIYLSAGQIVLECALPGGVGLVAGHYDVYDRGGQLLYRCPRRFDLPPMPRPAQVDVRAADQRADRHARPSPPHGAVTRA